VSISTEALTARAARGWQAVLVVGLGLAASGYGVQLISHPMIGSPAAFAALLVTGVGTTLAVCGACYGISRRNPRVP
jgi:hypothetical protein